MTRRVSNPPNPYTSRWAEYLEPPPAAEVHTYHERARSVLSHNDAPDLPFEWTVNPYRGCQHACAYCYARPYHEYLELGAGTDFETRLFAKINAPEVLRRELAAGKTAGAAISFSGVTDCYQPLEAVYELTRGCLEVCAEFANPLFIITRGYLVVRDLDLLLRLNQVARAGVWLSVAFADDATARLLEPHAPAPARRFEAMRRLHQAGVPVGVMVAPIIPGLNDSHIPRILQQAADSGAQVAACTALRLPGAVREVFLSRLRECLPLRAGRVEKRLREIRGGRLNASAYHARMSGQGVYWDSITQLFRSTCRRLGLKGTWAPWARPAVRASARPPSGSGQLSLDFDAPIGRVPTE